MTLERVDAHPRLAWRSPRSWHQGASLYAIRLEGTPSPAVGRALFEDHSIVVRAFGAAELNSVRVSPNTLNTDADLERFFAALETYL